MITQTMSSPFVTDGVGPDPLLGDGDGYDWITVTEPPC